MRNFIKHFFTVSLLCTLFFATISKADSAPLPVDQAFSLSVTYPEKNKLLVVWQIATDYQIYRKSLNITFSPTLNADITYPQGELKYDEIRGRYEAFLGSLSVPVTFNADASNYVMQIHYQGCSESGFCYPPLTRNYDINTQTMTVTPSLEITPTDASLKHLLTNQQSVKHVLESQSLIILLLIFLALGILLAFTPCVLPMIPILTSIIAGNNETRHANRAFILSTVYVLGSAITYAIAGIFVALIGGSLQVWLQQPLVIILTCLLFIALAFSLFGFYEVRLPHKLQTRLTHFSHKQKTGQILGVFLMGIISALIVSPCVTAPLVGVLLYIADTGNVLLGASALFALGIGMGLPLILVGTSAGKYLPRAGAFMESIKFMFGFMMIAMAIWLLSRIVSDITTSILYGILLLVIASTMIFHLPHFLHKKNINRLLAIVLALSGIFLIVNSATNLPIFSAEKSQKTSTITVKTISQLNQALEKANLAHKPVMVDFYADWCASCIVMEKTVLSTQTVQDALHPYVQIRADLSDNSRDSEALMKKYHVVAPPTILFFNENGEEQVSGRLVGEMSADEFLSRVKS